MRKATRSAGLALASIGTAATVALSGAASAGAANVALMVNGFGAGDLKPLEMAAILGGMFGGYQRQNVSWPQQARPITGANSLSLGESIDVGANNLDAALTTALAQLKPGEHVTLVGLSAGSLVVDQELRHLATQVNAPTKNQLNVVLAADSSRMQFNQNKRYALLNYTYQPAPVTKYNTSVLTAEYDGFADFPDRPNILAVVNAYAGILRHVPTMLTDLSTVPSSNITTSTNTAGGVTTNYFIPAAELPLVKLFPKLKPQEAKLKKIIDSAYSRNDAPSAQSVSPTTASPVARGATAAKVKASAATRRGASQ